MAADARPESARLGEKTGKARSVRGPVAETRLARQHAVERTCLAGTLRPTLDSVCRHRRRDRARRGRVREACTDSAVRRTEVRCGRIGAPLYRLCRATAELGKGSVEQPSEAAGADTAGDRWSESHCA